MSLSPREVEVVVFCLLEVMDYARCPRDSPGIRRAVHRHLRNTDSVRRQTSVATCSHGRRSPAKQTLSLIKCIHPAANFGVAYVRALLGAVHIERVNNAILVSTGGFTRAHLVGMA